MYLVELNYFPWQQYRRTLSPSCKNVEHGGTIYDPEAGGVGRVRATVRRRPGAAADVETRSTAAKVLLNSTIS
jgi:hypothetical protein